MEKYSNGIMSCVKAISSRRRATWIRQTSWCHHRFPRIADNSLLLHFIADINSSQVNLSGKFDRFLCKIGSYDWHVEGKSFSRTQLYFSINAIVAVDLVVLTECYTYSHKKGSFHFCVIPCDLLHILLLKWERRKLSLINSNSDKVNVRFI